MLSSGEKCRIYYSRVVDLAVASNLLVPDPDSEIGHFAFSRYYAEGKELDTLLMSEINRFEREHGNAAAIRTAELDRRFRGAVESYRRADPEEKIRELITIGATRRVWPTGTSFVLTYPWDLDGTGRVVSFREDLTDFMRRRVADILAKAGKPMSRDPFSDR
jgi:hypothetical protein